MTEKSMYLDILNNTIRQLQRSIKMNDAPIRAYNRGPRHIRTAVRHYNGEEIRELVVLNVGFDSCAWNNCRMCGLSTKAEKLTEDMLMAELEELSKLPHLKDKTVNSLYFSPYSFFSDREMSESAREKVYCEIINANPNIKHIVFMTRPEYLTEEKIAHMRKFLQKQEIKIWMGLETADEFINKYCIDKGYTIEEVDKASAKLKKYDVGTGVWAMLKVPFLTEKEGVQCAVHTIRQCLNRGYDVRLMPCEIMDYTVANELYKMNAFTAPYLWSVFEVLKQFGKDEHMKIDVSGPHFERNWDVVPKEIHSSHIYKYPSNCHNCNEAAMELIFEYNQKKDISIFDTLDCECKKDWLEEMARESKPIKDRLADEYLSVINYIVSR